MSGAEPLQVTGTMLIAAIEDIVAIMPAGHSNPAPHAEGRNDKLIARILRELGVSWQEISTVEDLIVDLDASFVPGAPIQLSAMSRRYFTHIDEQDQLGLPWSDILTDLDAQVHVFADVEVLV